jgi:hypothetical protein
MKNVLDFLKGKKTYIIVAIIALQALSSYLDGSINLAEAINQVLLGAGLGTLRAGVAK